MNVISQTPEAMPRMSAVKALDDVCIEVTWLAGARAGRTEKVDLAPLINSLKFFKPLRNDRSLFQTVHLSERGRSLLWGANDELDMGAPSVQRLAEDMMTAADLQQFILRLGYTHNTAAAQLGYSRRQIENFLAGTQDIPRVCALACIALQQRHDQQQALSFIGSDATHAAATADT